MSRASNEKTRKKAQLPGIVLHRTISPRPSDEIVAFILMLRQTQREPTPLFESRRLSLIHP